MKKFRMAIIGAGNICQSAHVPAYKKIDDVEIVARCRLEARARRVRLRRIFRDVRHMRPQNRFWQTRTLTVWMSACGIVRMSR